MGNPHAVLQVTDLADAPVLKLGAQLERHPIFPQRANIGFMQIHDRQRIGLRVFERGVGETLACGSGACAAVVIGIQQGLLSSPVSVELALGNMTIEWQGSETQTTEQPVLMTGSATTVYQGNITL
jgi:diaminopimelate epimerase